MALLDWLQDALGSNRDIVSGGNPMQPGPPPMVMNPYTGQEEPRRHVPPAPTQPMPPMQMTGSDVPLPPGGDPMTADQRPGQYPAGGDPMTADRTAAPYRPYPSGGDPMTAGGIPQPPMPPGGDPMTAGGVRPGGPGLPPRPGTPALPPNATPTAGIGTGINGVGPGLGVATPDQLRGSPQARGFIGRALGLDPNSEADLRGSLGAGLKAAGENMHKPGLAAFAGSAGSAIEGGKAASDKIVDQQGKVVDRAIASKGVDARTASAAVTDRLNMARTKLAEEQTKMASAGGKDSVMNSQQQLYLRGMGLVNADPEVKLAKSTYDAALKSSDPKAIESAKKAHEALVKAKTEAHMKALGVDQKAIDAVAKQPGMSQDNPMPSKGLTQDRLNALPPGTWVTGPDGKALQKKAPQGAPAGQTQPAPTQSMTPQAVQPPVPSVAPARNAMASMGADDEED